MKTPNRRRGTLAIAAIFLFAFSAVAGERKLSEEEIQALLGNNTVTGEDRNGSWRQFFDANGTTTYVQGSEPPSNGRWSVRAGKYCSQWPPSDGWACYDVTGDPSADPAPITWIGESGARYPGLVLKGNKL